MFSFSPTKTQIFGLLFTLFLSFTTIAQVGIGNTNPDSDALLEVGDGTDTKGILLPRLSLTGTGDTAPLSAHVAGMIVYNTNAVSDVTPGFYYNDGSSWVRLANNNDWKLTGNTGTTAGTNFLGTTDNVSLELFTNNLTRMRVEDDGQVTVGFGAAAANDYRDQFSVEAPSDSYAIVGYGSGTGRGVYGRNSGSGNAVRAFNYGTGYGIVSSKSGTGYSIGSWNNGVGNGIYNQTTDGTGMVNFIGGGGTGIYTNLATADYLSASGGIGQYIDLDVNNGIGVYVSGVDNNTTPTDGGDIFSFFSAIDTDTPTISSTVSGAILAGSQYGVGHGILVNHRGSEGRNAEFNIHGTSNSDPAIFSVHSGDGSVIIGQNQNDSPAGIITVADFSYTGSDQNDHIGVSGSAITDTARKYGIGVEGIGGRIGVHGVDAGNGSAGGTGPSFGVYATGDIGASGTKSFIIDHPNDPANKYLKHFAIESNEVLNIYRGTAFFDASGRTTIQLPEYYSTINKNASYQLTAIGAAMPNLFIEREVNSTNTFVIAGGIAEKKVSWVLTAERNDPYLQQNPEKRDNVLDKGEDRGKYLTPQLYNQPKESGMFYREVIKHETSSAKPPKIDHSKIPKLEVQEDDEKSSDKKQKSKTSEKKN